MQLPKVCASLFMVLLIAGPASASTFAPNTGAPNASTPNALAHNALAPNTLERNASTPNALAHNALTPNTLEPNASKPGAFIANAFASVAFTPSREAVSSGTDCPSATWRGAVSSLRDRSASGQILLAYSNQEALSIYNTGLSQMNAKDYAAAESSFNRALILDPDLTYAHWNLGVILTQQNKFEDALVHLKQATEQNPRLGGAWNALGVCLNGLGRTSEAVAAFQKYLALEPNGPLAANLRKVIPVLLADARKKGNQPASADDYYQESVAAHFGKWAAMPITVFIANPAGVRGYRAQFTDVLKQAFADWQNSTNGAVSFAFVDSQKQAQVVCSFTDSLKNAVNASEGGHCYAQQDGSGHIHSASIAILTVVPAGVELNDTHIRRVALHEIGHALGFAHSRNGRDIMFAATIGGITEANLSQRDINTAQHMYRGATAVNHIANGASGSGSAASTRATGDSSGLAAGSAQSLASVANKPISAAPTAALGNALNGASGTATGASGNTGAPTSSVATTLPDFSFVVKPSQVAEQAKKLFKSGLHDAAIGMLEDAYRQSPNDLSVATTLGESYASMAADAADAKDVAAADSFYKKSIPLLDKNPISLQATLKKYADFLKTQNRTEEATAIETKIAALAQTPGQPGVTPTSVAQQSTPPEAATQPTATPAILQSSNPLEAGALEPAGAVTVPTTP